MIIHTLVNFSGTFRSAFKKTFCTTLMGSFSGYSTLKFFINWRRYENTSVNLVHKMFSTCYIHNMYQMICTCGRINLHRPVTSSVAARQFVFQCTCGLQSQMAKKQTWTRHRTAICEGYTLLGSQNALPSFPLHRKASAQYSTNGAKYKHISCCTFVAQV